MFNPDYDVIIIGGRNAGSSLAIHLARQNMKVLLVDRATFPSLPSVPSSPIIHPGTMRLLDELGIAEKEYALPGGKAERYVLEFVNHFTADIPTSQIGLDRSYVYGLDRHRFDTVLWDHARKFEQVTARDNFSVTQILKNLNDEVVGIVGKSPQGAEEHITARLVVGADGRFSFAAKQFGAKVLEERNQYRTASFHAEWENVADHSNELPHAVSMYNTAKGFAVLFIPIDHRKYIVGTYMQLQSAQRDGESLQDRYLADLKSIPAAWRRLEQAKQVTEVVGVRPINNGYREAYGKGWALVGDAFHYKDPVDSQGIYDALLESKILAECLVGWKDGSRTWAEVGEDYKQRAMRETFPMFEQTVARVQKEMFSFPPKFIINTVIRWMLNDPEYQTTLLRYISRAIDPRDYKATPSPAVLLRGLAKDIQRKFAPKPAQSQSAATSRS